MDEGVNWPWILDHLEDGSIADLVGRHIYLSVLPVVYGLLVSLPVGILCVRFGWLYPPVLATTSVVYALPSLALFALLLPFTGLESSTVIIPLTLYTLSVLVRNVVDGLRAVPDPVRQSAVAMGFGAVRRLVRVELPIAVPYVIAGLRVATVSTISLVSVGSLVGVHGLGELFTDGFRRTFPTPILVGIVLTVLLAVAADGLLVGAQRLLTPWARSRRAAA